MACLLKSFARKKRLDETGQQRRKLASCLTTWDLTSLGIGATLGAGIYVVAGQVASGVAGPAVTISFGIAAFASILSGLCYAEFGARVPRTTGSAYTYSYVTVGELWAFVIGWNLILEYMIGTAADARALSGCFDFIIGYAMKNFTLSHIGEHRLPGLDAYPDVFSFVLTVVVTGILATGVRQSSTFTTFFNVLNIFIVIFIIAVGLCFANLDNWSSQASFFPYGPSGVLSGAATCFYAFVGFDIIATTGEEAKSAAKSIPKAIVLSLVIIFLCYVGVSAVLTLMVPFDQLDELAPIPQAFAQIGFPAGKYIVGVGAICGLSASLLGSQFPLPRIIYAMSCDGLIFKYFSKVNSKTEIPVRATICPGVVTALFALFLDLKELVEMMSIGTLLAYTIVSTCVLILRYQPEDAAKNASVSPGTALSYSQAMDESVDSVDEFDFEFSNGDYRPLLKDIGQVANLIEDEGFCGKRTKYSQSSMERIPTAESARLVRMAVSLLFVGFCGLCGILAYALDAIRNLDTYMIFLAAFFTVLSIFAISVIAIQPQNPRKLSFKVPLVPAVPILAVLSNVFLMMKLSRLTWIRFAIWMALGKFSTRLYR